MQAVQNKNIILLVLRTKGLKFGSGKESLTMFLEKDGVMGVVGLVDGSQKHICWMKTWQQTCTAGRDTVLLFEKPQCIMYLCTQIFMLAGPVQ